ncbi:MAG: holo-ACP synthase [candidate division KSB1 bacterium]|nr:holo-ACP synthase [candidate division KSB1 bacterium]MDZ7296240.1 holo-ACP synthase [candidate division KSB1 bacterium]MDZ7393075.1 holo-ACP synthase [candidate division KSB1 bacterium]MDZ7413459.1 holo-ACP synthase [candidate division KSB1 bacterium]
MVLGVGVDIIEIERVAEEIQRHGERFLKRVYAPEEVAYCEEKSYRAQHYAVRFAAKEATFKALGTGWQDGLSWQDVVLRNDAHGKPALALGGRARELAEQKGVARAHVSVSHCRTYAAAVVVLESE